MRSPATTPGESSSTLTAAGSVTIEAEGGTENSLTLAEAFQPADGEADAAVYAKSDLTLTGEGTISVSGGVRDGVNCRGSLTISSLALRVDAADDGIVGKSSVTAGEDAQITVTSGGDGIKATEDADAALGFVTLGAGRYSITAGNDGVQAETALTVSGGEYTITSGGGAAAAASLDEDGSYKGLKAGTTLAVTEGDLALDCADDALHADCVELSGGALCIASGDDGVHADSALTVSGGTIDISEAMRGWRARRSPSRAEPSPFPQATTASTAPAARMRPASAGCSAAASAARRATTS